MYAAAREASIFSARIFRRAWEKFLKHIQAEANPRFRGRKQNHPKRGYMKMKSSVHETEKGLALTELLCYNLN